MSRPRINPYFMLDLPCASAHELGPYVLTARRYPVVEPAEGNRWCRVVLYGQKYVIESFVSTIKEKKSDGGKRLTRLLEDLLRMVNRTRLAQGSLGGLVCTRSTVGYGVLQPDENNRRGTLDIHAHVVSPSRRVMVVRLVPEFGRQWENLSWQDLQEWLDWIRDRAKLNRVVEATYHLDVAEVLV